MDDIAEIVKFYVSDKDISLGICAYKDMQSLLYSSLCRKGIECIKDEKDVGKLLFIAKNKRSGTVVVLLDDLDLRLENAYILLDLRSRNVDKSDISWKEFFHVLLKGDLSLFLSYAENFTQNRDNCVFLLWNILKIKEQGKMDEYIKNAGIMLCKKLKCAAENGASTQDIEMHLLYLYTLFRGNKEEIKNIEKELKYAIGR